MHFDSFCSASLIVYSFTDAIQKSITTDPDAAATEVGEELLVQSILSQYGCAEYGVAGGSIDAAALIASLRSQLQSQQSDIERLQVKLTELTKDRDDEVCEHRSSYFDHYGLATDLLVNVSGNH